MSKTVNFVWRKRESGLRVPVAQSMTWLSASEAAHPEIGTKVGWLRNMGSTHSNKASTNNLTLTVLQNETEINLRLHNFKARVVFCSAGTKPTLSVGG